jgi:hypothetical protein
VAVHVVVGAARSKRLRSAGVRVLDQGELEDPEPRAVPMTSRGDLCSEGRVAVNDAVADKARVGLSAALSIRRVRDARSLQPLKARRDPVSTSSKVQCLHQTPRRHLCLYIQTLLGWISYHTSLPRRLIRVAHIYRLPPYLTPSWL